jgi:diguanylate cyclase (GGDEF)-like protein
VPVYPIRFDDGGCSKLRMTTIPLFDERGRISHLLSIAEDITEMLSQQKALRQSLEELGHSERRLRLITDNVPVAITYIDRDMVYRFANATMQDWIAGGVVGVQGRRVAEVLPALEFSERRDYMNEALGGRRVEFDRTPTGDQPRYLHTTYLPDIGDDGQVLGIYTLAADVSVHKRNELSLQKLARFDHLTGLPNRGQLHETLEAMLTRSRRTGTAIAVLFLDIDHFKSINDTLGHARGDEVLKEFARRLQDGVRATDTVARLAGDEFVILLEGLRCLSDADLVAEKILRNVNRPWEFDGAMLGVTTSVGVVCDRSHAHSGDDLIAIADEMLYASKSAGRNTFRVRVV